MTVHHQIMKALASEKAADLQREARAAGRARGRLKLAFAFRRAHRPRPVQSRPPHFTSASSED